MNRTMSNCYARHSEPLNRLILSSLMLLCCCRNTCIAFGHCPDDNDYPMRWNALKLPPSASQRRKRAQTIWQPRYWEHQIRDDRDFEKHCDYIHWNPMKHGLVSHPGAWPFRAFTVSYAVRTFWLPNINNQPATA